MKCPKCGCEAEARPNNKCFCNYCGYDGRRKSRCKKCGTVLKLLTFGRNEWEMLTCPNCLK